MRVYLRKPWYVDGHYFRSEPKGVEIPDRFRNQLPETAKVLDEKPKAKPEQVEEATKKVVAKDLDLERAGRDLVDAKAKKAQEKLDELMKAK